MHDIQRSNSDASGSGCYLVVLQPASWSPELCVTVCVTLCPTASLEIAVRSAGQGIAEWIVVEISTLLTLVSPEKAKWLRLKHPRAYLRHRSGMRSGIIRYDSWFLVDPDVSVADLSEAKTPEAAFNKAYYKDSAGFNASMKLGD